jgi:hypothetical protein
MDHVIAALLDMPDWAPKAARNVAALIIVGAILFAPGTFNRGLAIFIAQTQHRIEQIMQPILDDLATPATDATRSTTFTTHSSADDVSVPVRRDRR